MLYIRKQMIMIMTYCCLLLKGYWFYVLIFLSASYNWISVENLTTMRVSDWIRFNLYLRTQKLSSILVNWIVERNDNFITISLKKKKRKKSYTLVEKIKGILYIYSNDMVTTHSSFSVLLIFSLENSCLLTI